MTRAGLLLPLPLLLTAALAALLPEAPRTWSRPATRVWQPAAPPALPGELLPTTLARDVRERLERAREREGGDEADDREGRTLEGREDGAEEGEEAEGEEAEEAREREAREAWIEAMHGHPPGVDWRAIERENARRQASKKAAIVRARAAGAPPPDGSPADDDAWTERGSQNQAGRMYVGRLGGDGSTLYGGSSLGGLWSRAAGGEWVPLSDAVYGGVHYLETFPSPTGGPEELLIGSQSGLLYRSIDGGLSWEEPAGLSSPSGQRRLRQVSDGSGTVFSILSSGRSYGLWRSTDRGANWSQIRDLDDHASDIWMPRDGTSTLYLATAATLEVSTDLGDTWETRGNYATNSNRTELAGSEAAGSEANGTGGDGEEGDEGAADTGAGTAYPRLYVVDDGKDLRRSDDGGFTWTDMAEVQGDYWGVLEVSAIDPELVVWGGMELHRSRDGGATSEKVDVWSDYYDSPEDTLHADMMGLYAVPDGKGGETWYIGTDGGLYTSTDALATVHNESLSGLRVSQYYSTLTSAANTDHVHAGAQDQGYQITQGQAPSEHLLNFEQSISGDYGHLVSSDGSHEIVYSVYPGYFLINVGEDAPVQAWANFPRGATAYPWIPFLAADPDDAEICYFGAQNLYQYQRAGQWRWNDSQVGETPWSDDGANAYITALAFAPTNHDRVYAITSAGGVWRSDDHAQSFTRMARGMPDAQYWYGNAIAVSAADPDLLYVGGSGYAGPAVFRSTDGGDTFQPWSDGLPSTTAYALAEDPASGMIYAGTETAAYRRGPTGEWEDITGAEAPTTIYWSVEIVGAQGAARFGTYGRGIWDFVFDEDLDGCPDGVDLDGDGALCVDDCDDHDPARSPLAAELCGDGIDQDCDGVDAVCDDPGDSGNDDPGDGRPDLSYTPPPDDLPHCGCTANAPVGASLPAALALLALGARRRR